MSTIIQGEASLAGQDGHSPFMLYLLPMNIITASLMTEHSHCSPDGHSICNNGPRGLQQPDKVYGIPVVCGGGSKDFHLNSSQNLYEISLCCGPLVMFQSSVTFDLCVISLSVTLNIPLCNIMRESSCPLL